MTSETKSVPTVPPPNMNDGAYLELCDQLKSMNDKREKEQRQLQKQLLKYQHMILSAYGIIRSADELINICNDMPYEPMLLIDVLRQQLESFVNKDILKVKCEHDDIEILAEIVLDNNITG